MSWNGSEGKGIQEFVENEETVGGHSSIVVCREEQGRRRRRERWLWDDNVLALGIGGEEEEEEVGLNFVENFLGEGGLDTDVCGRGERAGGGGGGGGA
ncbi:hypothetical protein R1flu_025142 [Riccia fluitans]|uniref:Uncharacterized protein n=1 Tax=Riccia fluitans TaxID=41844 RepID=A0ABD1XXA4_9MARC